MTKKGKMATGLICSNCKQPVVGLVESVFTPAGWVPRRRAQCDCTLGFYKTNLSRSALQREYWKGEIT